MITQACDADIPAIARMLHDLNALHAHHRPDRFHDHGPQDALCAFLRDQMGQGARILLYVTEGVPRGYLMWKDARADPTALEHARGQAVLDHIHVEPVWRRRGLASRLIARFETDLKAEGLTGWRSQVHTFNHASAALMRRHGAEVTVDLFERQAV
ncbi:GNAT family N-acetyltransferase [Tropicibacter alexandrii]|uniref:GNAT family N-acetyltransferase n=1 Tax=Tropicibacter alexandrii TaxID=2267683 RepID=UPI000EF553C4|nr:GNAT family N-acetyltransferase [Tropicibacter alexandrii]